MEIAPILTCGSKAIKPKSPFAKSSLRFLTLFLLLACFCQVGCVSLRSPAQVTGENSWNREKDVVEFSIGLNGPMSADEYLEWTQQHLEKNQLATKNPGFPEIPVYEVRYYFFSRERSFRGYLGTVLWRRAVGPTGNLEHVTTIVQRGF